MTRLDTTTGVHIDATAAGTGGGLSYLIRQLPPLVKYLREANANPVVYASRKNVEQLADVADAGLRIVHEADTPHRRFLWQQYQLPKLPKVGEPIYCPLNFSPLYARRSPVITTYHNPNYVGPGRRMSHNRSLRSLYRMRLSRLSFYSTDVIVAISETMARWIASDFPRLSGKIAVVQSGAPPNHVPSGEVLPPDRPYILSVANDYPHKRLPFLAKAWAMAAADKDAPLVDLVFIGHLSPTTKAEISEAVPERLSRFVHFRGAITNPAIVSNFYSHANALVVPSVLEAHPLTPAEAGQYGCPLVLSDIPAHREVARDNAKYVDPGRVEDWIDAISGLGKQDRIHRSWDWPFSWEQNGEKVAELIVGACMHVRVSF